MGTTNAFAALAGPPIDRRHFLRGAAAGAAGLWLASPFTRMAFGEETRRTDDLIFHQQNPLNAEPPLGVLPDTFLTPTKNFYVRNHGNIPAFEPQSYRLKVEGLVETPKEFTLKELIDSFPNVETVATMTCAGNRRREHNAFKPVAGVQWDAGAIGNATWKGVRLADVLKTVRLKEGAAHVWFEGADQISVAGSMTNFGGSVPLAKAMNEEGGKPGALLAWDMNGEALSPEHGHPLRTVVPGYIGARSVKWLTRVVVSDRPSPNHYVQSAYKPVTEDSDVLKSEQNPVYRFPINVAICDPAPKAKMAVGNVTVRGYALPTGLGDARIRDVEVSANGGRRWVKARLLDDPASFCWTRWEAELPISDRTTGIVARAADTAGGVTPDQVSWNLHGYLYNGWHIVPVQVGA